MLRMEKLRASSWLRIRRAQRNCSFVKRIYKKHWHLDRTPTQSGSLECCRERTATQLGSHGEFRGESEHDDGESRCPSWASTFRTTACEPLALNMRCAPSKGAKQQRIEDHRPRLGHGGRRRCPYGPRCRCLCCNTPLIHESSCPVYWPTQSNGILQFSIKLLQARACSIRFE